MIDNRGIFILIMAYENECLVPSFTECFNNIFGQAAVHIVETMERLIKYQQFWVFHKGTRQEYHTLFAA